MEVGNGMGWRLAVRHTGVERGPVTVTARRSDATHVTGVRLQKNLTFDETTMSEGDRLLTRTGAGGSVSDDCVP